MWSSVRCQDNDSFGRAPLVLTDCEKYLVTAPVCGLTLLGSVANRKASMPYSCVSMKNETSSLNTRRPPVNSRVGALPRSEEGRVGDEGASTCRSRWSAYHSK